MRKWGKWVAEIHEPNKRSRIWLGSYSTAVAAARACDTVLFYLRSRSERLNFPDQIDGAAVADVPDGGHKDGAGAGLTAAAIRKKVVRSRRETRRGEAGDVGKGFCCICLNFNAFDGDKDHNGVHDGTTVVPWGDEAYSSDGGQRAWRQGPRR